MTSETKSARSFLTHLQAGGRATFTTEELSKGLGRSLVASRAALRRLRAAGEVASPLRGFHTVVPPEYRALGSLPADQFVPDLMAHLGEPYYATLLTAAAFHGASHQVPQLFQVMLARRRRNIQCGSVRVEFLSRSDMAATPLVPRNTNRGVLLVASAAATALEVVGYSGRSGGLDNVATILGELAEEIDEDELRAEIERAPKAWAQRLGYLAEHVGAGDLARVVEQQLHDKETFWVALEPSLETGGMPGDQRWKVAVNTTLEPDL